MGVPSHQRRPGDGVRRCAGCGSHLAVDNTARLCGRCQREQRDQLATPPAHLRNEFFETDEFRAAFRSQHIGNVFKAYRNHPRHLRLFGKALSQELLGRWLGLNQGQISKLENGKPEQNIETLQHYATVLHLPHNMLWFDFPGESRFDSPNADVILSNGAAARPIALPGGGGQQSKDVVNALIRLTATESTRFGLEHEVSELHASTIEQVEEEVHRLSVDFVYEDPFSTFMRSRQLRDTIFGLLEKRVFPRQERLLYAFAARACGYLAAASSDFYGQYDAGADQCRVARRLSDVADLGELRAWVMGLHSGISFWQGNWRQAATLAERASDLAVTRSGALRAASMHARALARLGDIKGLQAVIVASEDRLADVRTDDESGMILFSERNHLRNLGTANLWAGNSVEARDQLTTALQSYLSDARDNFAVIATIRADLAISHLNLRDIDGASEVLSPLLTIEAARRLEGTFRRMRDLRSLLRSNEYAASAVSKDLLDRIEDFLATSRRVISDEP